MIKILINLFLGVATWANRRQCSSSTCANNGAKSVIEGTKLYLAISMNDVFNIVL